MPFPTAGDVFVGPDLDEALQAWMTSPAISVDSGMNGSYGAFGGAAGGSIAGDAALRGGDFSSGGIGSPTYNNLGPSLLNAALVSGSLGASPGLSQPDSTGGDPSSTSGLTASSFNTSGSTGTTDFGSNARPWQRRPRAGLLPTVRAAQLRLASLRLDLCQVSRRRSAARAAAGRTTSFDRRRCWLAPRRFRRRLSRTATSRAPISEPCTGLRLDARRMHR